MKKGDPVYFKVHTLNLMNEVIDRALIPNMGIIKIPINQFMRLLGEVTDRAAMLNDPELNALMCRLTLYEQSDIQSKEYDQKATQETIDKGMAAKRKRLRVTKKS